MRYTWCDYGDQFKDAIDGWKNDALTLRFATDDGIDTDHRYYMTSPDYAWHDNYFCKVALMNGQIVAVLILLSNDDGSLAINPIIINPEMRGKYHCGAIIDELIHHVGEIIPGQQPMFTAGIDLANTASIRAFEKNGFSLFETHPDGDFAQYHYPPGTC